MYTLFTYTYKIVIGILNTKWTIKQLLDACLEKI